MGAEVLPAKVQVSEKNSQRNRTRGKAIRMDDQWGRLREVIVGIVRSVPSYHRHSLRVLRTSLKTITCFQQCHEKPAKQALPEAFTVARRQVEALVRLFT